MNLRKNLFTCIATFIVVAAIQFGISANVYAFTGTGQGTASHKRQLKTKTSKNLQY